MTATSRAVSAEHFAYLSSRTAGDDEFLVDLKRAAAAADIPAIWISPEQASLMQILLRLHGAQEVVEVGTLAGYSAIAMARALPEAGRVRTIEVKGRHADFAEDWIGRSDVAGRIEVLRGRALDVLPGLAADSADAVFIDADKASYVGYLAESLRIVRRGGLVMVDNAFAFGRLLDGDCTDPDVEAVRAFNDHMAGVHDLQSIIVPIGDGLWVGVKL